MSIHIGDNNRIHKSTIAEKININNEFMNDRTFYENHPVLCGLLISLIAGIVLLFHFWGKVISFIEELF